MKNFFQIKKIFKNVNFGIYAVLTMAVVLIFLAGFFLVENDFYSGNLNKMLDNNQKSLQMLTGQSVNTGEIIFKNCSDQEVPTEYKDSKISRGFFSMMMVKAFGLQKKESINFMDVKEDNSCKKYIEIAAGNKFIESSGKDRFNPDGLISKAEALRSVYLVFKKSKDISKLAVPETPFFSDITKEKWYFKAVQTFRSALGPDILKYFDPDGNGIFFNKDFSEHTTWYFAKGLLELASKY